MSLALVILLLATPFEEALAEADRLAAAARAAPAGRKPAAVDAALAAYDRALALKRKDPKLAPRVRRRRASLLKHAGRGPEALAEYDAIIGGRARRKDRARALYDGALLLERGADFAGAERRLARAIEDYGDDVRTRAKASLVRGRVLEKMARPKEAEKAYRFVVEKCRDETKPCVEAYDALALLALRRGDRKTAHKWLRRCMDRFEKKATRNDRYGAFVARLLASMKSPKLLCTEPDPIRRTSRISPGARSQTAPASMRVHPQGHRFSPTSLTHTHRLRAPVLCTVPDPIRKTFWCTRGVAAPPGDPRDHGAGASTQLKERRPSAVQPAPWSRRPPRVSPPALPTPPAARARRRGAPRRRRSGRPA